MDDSATQFAPSAQSLSARRVDLAILGCGYLGREIARRARLKGLSVAALTRNTDMADTLRQEGIKRVIQGDLQEDDWHAEVDSARDVVLCAGAGGKGLEGYRNSYLHAMESLLRWADKVNPETVIFTSSTSVYPQTNGQWMSESDATAEPGTAAEILLETEEKLLRYVADNGSATRGWVLRLAGIYGPSRHLFLNALQEGAQVLPGEPHTWLNLIHRDDAAEAVLLACEVRDASSGGILNICDGKPAPRGEIISWLAAELNRPEPTYGGPGTARRSSWRTGKGGVAPHRRISSQLAKEVLNWEPDFPDYQAGYRAILDQGADSRK